jgi:hypothetical protein
MTRYSRDVRYERKDVTLKATDSRGTCKLEPIQP